MIGRQSAHPRKALWLAIAGVLLALIGVALGADTAGAAVRDDEVDQMPMSGVEKQLRDTQDRSTNRWKDATGSFHSKFDGFIGTQIVQQAERFMSDGGALKWGNGAHGITSEFTQFAVQMNVIDGLGAQIDSMAGIFLRALFGETGGAANMLIVSFIVFAVIFIIARNASRGFAQMLRQLGALVLSIGLAFGMVSQALNHDPGSGSTYNPAPLTPGWVVKTVNDGIATLAAAPVAAFTTGATAVESGFASLMDTSLGGNLNCAKMMNNMRADVNEINVSGRALGISGTSLVATATVMDAMWETTGLYTWAKTQGGYGNPYIDKMYCRILDIEGGAWPVESATTTARGLPQDWRDAIVTDSSRRAPFAPDTTNNKTASLIAWAACEPTGIDGGTIQWSWSRGWDGYQGGIESPTSPRGQAMTAENAQEKCNDWWTAKSTDDAEQDIPDIFDVKGDAGWITDRTRDSSEQVREFLLRLTGTGALGSSGGTAAYAIGSTISLLAFGAIDIATIGAKVLMVGFILALYAVAIVMMFSPSQMKDRAAKTANQLIGTATIASMTTLIVAFVVVFSSTLIRFFNSWLGAGTLGAMILSGLAPAVSLVIMHFLFTKVLKMPSPVTIGGAAAWGKAGISGAMGNGMTSAVGAGVGSMLGTRLGNMGAKAMKGAARSVGNRMRGAGGSRRGMADAVAKSAADKKADDKAATEQPEVALSKAEQRKQDRVDLAAARREHIAEHGAAAPGDWRGAAGLAGAAAAGFVGGKARALGGKAAQLGERVKGAAYNSPLASELRSRMAARQATLEVRGMDKLAREEARKKITAATAAGLSVDAAAADAGLSSGAAARALLGAGTARGANDAMAAGVSKPPVRRTMVQRVASAIDAPAAAAHRTRLGASDAVSSVWNSPKVQSARATAAVLRHEARQGAEQLGSSDVVQDAAKAARATAVIARAAGRVSAKGAKAVASKRQNDRELLAEYRAKREAARMADEAAKKRKEPAKPKTTAPAVTMGAEMRGE